MLRTTLTNVLVFATLVAPNSCCCAGESIFAKLLPTCMQDDAAHQDVDVRHVYGRDTCDCSRPCCQHVGQSSSSCPNDGPCICQHDRPTALYLNELVDEAGLPGRGASGAAAWIALLPPANWTIDLPSLVLAQQALDSPFASASALLSSLSVLRC